MPTTLNKTAYQKLIYDDLDWLGTMPDCLERRHIADVIAHSVEVYYPGDRTVATLTAQLADSQARVDVALEALRDIADPVGKLRRELPEGFTLDTRYAGHLADSAHYLRSEAMKALKLLEQRERGE